MILSHNERSVFAFYLFLQIELRQRKRKEDQQLSSGIKVYTEKSLNVGFDFMLVMIALLFHAKLCFIINEIYKECAVRFYAIF